MDVSIRRVASLEAPVDNNVSYRRLDSSELLLLLIFLGKHAFSLNQVFENFRSESERILIQDNKEFYFYIEEIPCYDSD